MLSIASVETLIVRSLLSELSQSNYRYYNCWLHFFFQMLLQNQFDFFVMAYVKYVKYVHVARESP
jgi:hypothetical protein